MMDETRGFNILRITEEGSREVEEVVAREFPLTIILDNQELVTMLCTPKDLKYLAIGFLSSEGLIRQKGDIRKIILDDRRGVVRVETEGEREKTTDLIFKRLITSGCGSGAAFYRAADTINQAKVESSMRVSAGEVFTLTKEFQQSSPIYRATHGVHSAAMCDTNDILIFTEDIGRHNAIDKIFGRCILEDISTDDRIIISSGRISSEVVLKTARRNIPIVISKSSPTDLAVDLAARLGVTLIGFVRGKKMNVYTEGWRVTGH
jgi:FdhD protein